MPDKTTLVGFMKFLSDEAHSYCFGNLFPLVADSYLTAFLVFFLASWIFSICVSIGKGGAK